MTGLIKLRRASDPKITPKKKSHNKLKRLRKMRKNMCKVQIFRIETKLGLQFCGIKSTTQILPNAEGNGLRCSKRTVQKHNTNQNKLTF
jgi:hypothetical protein